LTKIHKYNIIDYMNPNSADNSYEYDDDVPEQLRGQRLVRIFVRDGNDIAVSSAPVGTVPPLKMDVPTVIIRGVSEEVEERVYELAHQWRIASAVSTLSLTRAAVLRALLSEGN
jgi:hypothetical protein